MLLPLKSAQQHIWSCLDILVAKLKKKKKQEKKNKGTLKKKKDTMSSAGGLDPSPLCTWQLPVQIYHFYSNYHLYVQQGSLGGKKELSA